MDEGSQQCGLSSVQSNLIFSSTSRDPRGCRAELDPEHETPDETNADMEARVPKLNVETKTPEKAIKARNAQKTMMHEEQMFNDIPDHATENTD